MTDNANNDPIGNALNITPIESSKAVTSIIAEAHNDSAKQDFEIARSNIHNMIENGQEAMLKLAQIADSSQHPRAFEVLAKLMDSMVIANEKLLELQKEIKEIDKANAPNSEQAKSITNNLFVGSTAELQKVLKDMRNDRNPEL